jgi:hypothetical protein
MNCSAMHELCSIPRRLRRADWRSNQGGQILLVECLLLNELAGTALQDIALLTEYLSVRSIAECPI